MPKRNCTRIASKVDTCNDLYGIAKGLPAEQLLRETKTWPKCRKTSVWNLAKLDAERKLDRSDPWRCARVF